MKSKLNSADQEVGDGRRAAGRSSNSRLSNMKSSSSSARSSHSPSSATRAGSLPSSGAGRTPQTKRRELSLTAEKNSPSGSPRNVNKTLPGGRKSGTNKNKSDNREVNVNNEESSRKSSNSSQDSGIGRESKLSRGERTRSGQNLTKSMKNPPIIRTSSPDRVDIEVSNRKRFEELCDIKNIELGMVKVPPDILEDLINKENIEKILC